MVIVVDLDEDVNDPAISRQHDLKVDTASVPADDQTNANPHADSFAQLLISYPIVSSISQWLDLNSLHDLAFTARAMRYALLESRSQLVKHTLRCVNDETYERALHTEQRWHPTNDPGRVGRMTRGRVSVCARDLVGDCRRCGTVVCRNCTIKPPPTPALKGRHRRLCKTCQKTPLRHHTHDLNIVDTPSFTSEAYNKGSCCCEDTVWLCLSCGNALRSADTTYMRGWTWRTRYSTYLGGMGTGIGEGNEGVECGKGDQCLAAKEVEKEIDCDADELADLKREIEEVERQGRHWGGTSYHTQEIEGIGGVVKKKVKKRVKVGAVVKEYEDEREKGRYLRREQDGLNRSWCFWCCRIIPTEKDKSHPGIGRSITETSSSSSVDFHSDD